MEEARTVSVVGGANIDIVAKSNAIYFPGTSNPGTVTETPGGVGRNIAHMLALLGVEVEPYSVVGDDSSGKLILDSARTAGIRTDSVLITDEEKTGQYVAVQDADGTLASAVSDMRAMELLTPELLEQHRERLQASRMIVTDTNIPDKSLLWLSELSASLSIPLYVEPVSKEKTGKLRSLPQPAEWISPSEKEFLELFRLPKRGFETLILSMEEKPGVPLRLAATANRNSRPSKNLLVTLGRRGVVHMRLECDDLECEDMETGKATLDSAPSVYAPNNSISSNSTGRAGADSPAAGEETKNIPGERVDAGDGAGIWCGNMYRPYSVEVINDNGAGDAFFAGFIAGRWHGKSQEESIYYGLAAAARVVRCPDAVDEDLNFDELSSYISTHETRD